MIRTGRRAAPVFLLVCLMAWMCGRGTPPPQPPEGREPPLANLERSKIEEIFLHLPQENVRLRRQGTFWYLPDWNNYPADAVYVDVLLNALADLKWGEEVTNRAEEYARYGLGAEAKTISLRDGQGEEMAAIQVGHYGKSYREAYFKLPGRPEAYLAKTDLFPALSRVTWADRTVWRMQPEVIEEVFVTGFPQDFHAKKTKEQRWQFLKPAGTELPETFPMRVLPRLAFLRAGNIELETRPAERFETERTINIVVGTATLTLELGRVDQDVILGRKGVDPVIFKFSPALLQMIESVAPPP